MFAVFILFLAYCIEYIFEKSWLCLVQMYRELFVVAV